MTYNPFIGGSNWAKWDLHVHSPASFHWKGSKRFAEMSSSEIEISLEEMYQTIESSDVVAFALMDYWTFDGYKLFRKYCREKGKALTKAIFPGMELRIEAPTDYRLNIHVILSDDLSDQQLDDFKAFLRIRSINRALSNEAIQVFAKTLDEGKARVHGFADPTKLNPDDLLLLGSATIEITPDSFEEALKALPEASGFVFMPWDTSDGLSKLDWKKHPHAAHSYLKSGHIFESRKKEVADCFNNVQTEQNASFIQDFQKSLGGIPRPVVCGSDAHKYSDYGNFPSGKATWIKANPTFNGLRQILFEPKDRVKVQVTSPHDRTPYLMIDKVKFESSSGDKTFSNDWIHLNSNLNVIIGGKSSGKSLLLYHIAKAIDPSQVEGNNALVGLPKELYNFSGIDGFDVKVSWGDGHIDAISKKDKSLRPITYLPQMYINLLSEDKGKKNLAELIEDILRQNPAFKSFFDKTKSRIQEIKTEILGLTGIIFSEIETLNKYSKEKSEVGQEAAIQVEVNRLEEEIRKLRSESGFTPEEEKKYKDITSYKTFQSNKIRDIEDYQSQIEEFESFLDKLKGFIESSESSISRGPGGKQKLVRERLLKRFTATLSSEIETEKKRLISLQQNISTKIEKHRVLKQEAEARTKPFDERVQNQEQLKVTEKKLIEENDKLKASTLLQEKILSQIAGISNSRNLIKSKYKDLFEAHKSIQAELEKYSDIGVEIKLNAKIGFDVEDFTKCFCALFDNRAKFRTTLGNCFDDANEFLFNPETHVESISRILDNQLDAPDKGPRAKPSSKREEIVKHLLGDYFRIDYDIKYKNDDIIKMSPGKRGLVLLQLFLHISNADHPILIDQPEDNLDNRTVFQDLNSIIKEKKIKRQIILVTHNSNLAVSTDAENVVVCNQEGQQPGKENKEYKFEYVHGAIEHTLKRPQEKGILFQMGIREHVCDILEGGEDAFKKREQKYFQKQNISVT